VRLLYTLLVVTVAVIIVDTAGTTTLILTPNKVPEAPPSLLHGNHPRVREQQPLTRVSNVENSFQVVYFKGRSSNDLFLTALVAGFWADSFR